jgi:osmotically-inducible protein OsmY
MYVKPSATEDHALAHRTRLFLHRRGICGAEQVVVKAERGTVIVCGPVASREARWQCLECCRHVAGVMQVIDQLRISSLAKETL